MANIYDMSDTWNDGATTFTAIKMDVTDTASASGSLLMDLQVGGASQFKVGKDAGIRFGTGQVAGASGVGLFSLDNTSITFGQDAGSTRWGGISASGFVVAQSSYYGWGNSTLSAPDLFLFRDAANTLAQRNSTNAQTFNIYNTYTDASNYERGFMKWNSNVLEIGAEAAGTGTGREIQVKQGGSTAIYVKSSQIEVTRLFIPVTTGGASLGAATKQWNNIYASGDIYFTGLPTSDPVNAGQLWNDGGTLKISAG